MCHGAARKTAMKKPLIGRSRFHVRPANNCLVRKRYSNRIATGKTAPIKLFSRTPTPRLAASTKAQNRGWLLLIERAQKCPHCQSDRQRQSHIGNNDSRE